MMNKILESMGRHQSDFYQIPGPEPVSIWQFSKSLMADPLGYMKNTMDQYGDIVRLPSKIKPIVQVTHPDLIGKLFTGTEK